MLEATAKYYIYQPNWSKLLCLIHEPKLLKTLTTQISGSFSVGSEKKVTAFIAWIWWIDKIDSCYLWHPPRWPGISRCPACSPKLSATNGDFLLTIQKTILNIPFAVSRPGFCWFLTSQSFTSPLPLLWIIRQWFGSSLSQNPGGLLRTWRLRCTGLRFFSCRRWFGQCNILCCLFQHTLQKRVRKKKLYGLLSRDKCAVWRKEIFKRRVHQQHHRTSSPLRSMAIGSSPLLQDRLCHTFVQFLFLSFTESTNLGVSINEGWFYIHDL